VHRPCGSCRACPCGRFTFQNRTAGFSTATARRIQLDWFYAGVNVGGGIDHFAFPYSINVLEPNNLLQEELHHGDRTIRGIQAGYNYELPFSHIVTGFEIDSDVSGIRGQTTATAHFSLVRRSPPPSAPNSRIWHGPGSPRLCVGPVSALFDRWLHLRNDGDLL